MYDDRELVRDDRLYIYLNTHEKAEGKAAAKKVRMQFAQFNREILNIAWQRINSMSDKQTISFAELQSRLFGDDSRFLLA